MEERINDETIEYVGILAKLELNEEEKANAKKDKEIMAEICMICLLRFIFTASAGRNSVLKAWKLCGGSWRRISGQASNIICSVPLTDWKGNKG